MMVILNARGYDPGIGAVTVTVFSSLIVRAKACAILNIDILHVLTKQSCSGSLQLGIRLVYPTVILMQQWSFFIQLLQIYKWWPQLWRTVLVCLAAKKWLKHELTPTCRALRTCERICNETKHCKNRQQKLIHCQWNLQAATAGSLTGIDWSTGRDSLPATRSGLREHQTLLGARWGP